MKLRKGDLGKAIILVILIIGLGIYITYRLMSASRPGGIQSSQLVQKQPPTDRQTPIPSDQGQMFGTRPPGSGLDLQRARTAPDPFRPITILTAATASSQMQHPRTQDIQPLTRNQPQLRPNQPQPDSPPFWLSGIVSGTTPLAVVRQDDEHYYVSQGDMLPGDWKVVRVNQTQMTVMKENRQVNLQIYPAPLATSGGRRSQPPISSR